MTTVKGKGRIWPEYWIDCSECEHNQPLATQREPSKAALQQGWRRSLVDGKAGPWICEGCVEDIKEIQQINAASRR